MGDNTSADAQVFYSVLRRVSVVFAWLALGMECHLMAQQSQLNKPTSSSLAPESFPPTFVIHQFRFVGHSVFSDEQLAGIVREYVNRPIDFLELDQARIDVTKFYVGRGYLNSGAMIDDLPDASGVVTIRIVEGRLTDVTIKGNKWLRAGFYRSRLGVDSDRTLNVNELRNRLQVWRQAYPLEQVNGELRPGAVPGQASLDVSVKERFPYHFGLQYANDRSPSVGSDRLSATAQAESLTGNGDQLSLGSVIARGNAWLSDAEFPGADDWSVYYDLPITARDTALGFHYVRSSAVVLEEAFRELDITGDSEVIGVSISQPMVRTPTRELSLTLSAERKSNRNFLLGVPYSFSPGAVDGESAVSALRLSGQWVERSQRDVFASRLTLNWGLGVLDATRNSGDTPDGQFFALQGQVHYLRKIAGTRNEIMIKLAGQYSPDPLLTLEQFGIGGANTVRGYRENTLLRDSGVTATLEFHVPLWIGRSERSVVQLVPFASIGAGWDNSRSASPNEITSAGIGVVANPVRQLEMALFWGHAFRRIRYTSHDLQDDGIHFRLNLWAF